jgi:ADP-dependent NAD(P)H-hydrate dehydratase / NAD(P)H-hydrate epimerase
LRTLPLNLIKLEAFKRLFVSPSVHMKNINELTKTLSKYLPLRNLSANKGNFGHVLIIGGDNGFSGAVRLAGEAAYRVGAGLVTVLTHPQHSAVLNLGRPELMCRSISRASELKKNLLRATVVVFGPGLGQSNWSKMLFNAFLRLKISLPIVLDADGLNWLSLSPVRSENWILTPHPGEAARLLGETAAKIQSHRNDAVQKLQRRYGGVSVLKGQNTLIQGQSLHICPFGNPGMASAGMGDVLSGVIGGLLAQGLSLELAASLGVYVHAYAGDLAAKEGERGLMALDLMPFLRKIVNVVPRE